MQGGPTNTDFKAQGRGKVAPRIRGPLYWEKHLLPEYRRGGRLAPNVKEGVAQPLMVLELFYVSVSIRLVLPLT